MRVASPSSAPPSRTLPGFRLRPFRPRGAVIRAWVPTLPLVLVVASEYDLRRRDQTASLGGSIDLAVAAEVASYAIVAAFLLMLIVRPVFLRRVPGVVWMMWLFTAVMVATSLYSPYGQLAIVRAVQLVVTAGVGHAIALRSSRDDLHALGHAFLVLAVVSPILGLALPRTGSPLEPDRFSFLAVHPNVAATIFGVAVVLAANYWWLGRGSQSGPRWPRPAYALLFATSALALVATRSRGLLIATILACLLLVISATQRRTRADFLAYGAAAAILVWITAGGPLTEWFTRGQNWERLATLNSRTELWDQAFQLAGQRPLLGHGFMSARGAFIEAFGLGGAHNAAIEVTVNSGVLGLIVWLSLLAAVGRGAFFLCERRRPAGRPLHPDGPLMLSMFALLVGTGITEGGLAQAATVQNVWLFLSVAWISVAYTQVKSMRTRERPSLLSSAGTAAAADLSDTFGRVSQGTGGTGGTRASTLTQIELDDRTGHLREYLAILRFRKWTIVAVTGLVLGASLGYSYLQASIYTAEARVLIEPYDAATPVSQLEVETQREIVSSESVAERVRDEINFSGSVRSLVENLDVVSVGETQVLRVSYSSPQPGLARAAANSFARNYVAYRQQKSIEGITAAQDAIQSRIEFVTDQLAVLNEDIDRARNTRDSELVTELETQRDVLISRLGVLQQRLDELQTQASGRGSGAEIVELAHLPVSPSSPNYVVNGVVGLFLGLALGVGLASLRERLDDRFRGHSDVERSLRAPILATIPRYVPTRKKARFNLIARSDPNAPASEAFKTLRTKLQFIASRHQIRSVLVASAQAGEGKSATVANLGATFAQAGHRVILISADLRRPTLARYFDLEDESAEDGLSTWLAAGEEEPLSLAREVGIPNLRVIPSGPAPPNPTELLSSQKLVALIRELEKHFDLLLLDSPPTLPVADAAIVASRVGGVLIVVDGSTTHRSAAIHAGDELERVGGSIVGCLLNKFDPTGSPYDRYTTHDGLSEVTQSRAPR